MKKITAKHINYYQCLTLQYNELLKIEAKPRKEINKIEFKCVEISIVLFSALTIESYINYFIRVTSNDDECKKIFKGRMPTKEKWKKYPKEKGIDINDIVFESIAKLMDLRNELAHDKAEIFSFESNHSKTKLDTCNLKHAIWITNNALKSIEFEYPNSTDKNIIEYIILDKDCHKRWW